VYIIVFHLLANIPLDVHPLFVSVQKRFWLQADVLAYILAGTSAGAVLQAVECKLRAGFTALALLCSVPLLMIGCCDRIVEAQCHRIQHPRRCVQLRCCVASAACVGCASQVAGGSSL
jgi:hypothetical protein